MNEWDVSLNSRYIGRARELLNQWYHEGDEERWVQKQLVHDFQASYNMEPWNTRFTLGVDNITDRQPPFAYSGFNDNTDPRTYETRGRFYYGRVTMSF